MKLKAVQKGNWALIFFSAIIFLIGLLLVAISILYWKQFQWWSLAFFSSGAPSMYFAYKAVKTNEPAWILLDLILPG